MTHPMRENGGPVSMEQMHELLGFIIAGFVGHGAMDDFLRKFRGRPKNQPADGYPAIFAAVVGDCGCDWNSPEMTPEEFTPDVLGTLGGDYVLGQPPKTAEAKKRGWWNEIEIDAWMASADVAGKGLEPAYLVDLVKYGKDNPDHQRERPIVCWRPTKNGGVACLDWRGLDRERGLSVRRRDGVWNSHYRFLLRKVRQS